MFEVKGNKKPHDGPKNKPIATALNEKEFEQFEKIAREQNLKNSELLRQMVSHCLKQLNERVS